MIAIADYGMGNLRSVEKALEYLGHAARVVSDPEELRAAERMILPGVGAFGAAMRHLREGDTEHSPLEGAVREFAGSGRPVLGICLGMQLLLSESDEMGRHAGLAMVPGEVRRFDLAPCSGLKVPHMGWNRLQFRRTSALLAGLPEESYAYFVHSYYCVPTDPEVVTATADHGGSFCAVIERGSLMATQFHPEKSGQVGLRILDNFARFQPSGTAD